MLFVAYFLLWLVFNGRVTVELTIFGIAIAAIMYWFSCKFCGYSNALDRKMISKTGRLLKLFGILFVEIVKSNLQVIYWVYQKKKPRKPAMVFFDADLKTNAAQVLLANCITLTPGTMTGIQEGNHYVVHCLDESMADGLDASVFIDALQDLEREERES